MVQHFIVPSQWIKFDPSRILGPLSDAKAAVVALTTVPYRRAWAEKLQEIQLKQEVAGTSRIEGAEFTEIELEAALDAESTDSLLSRSQRQAKAAVNTYRWIAKQDFDRPIDEEFIKEVHRRIVTGCDDDHCQPGALRGAGENVVFGSPRHRGVEGGHDCKRVFSEFCQAIMGEFRSHDTLIQGLAIHYHMGAMHPFLDGNGRTARALEAVMLQRSGLKDALFISLSNYYYEEKDGYLSMMAQVRGLGGDLTPFLEFGLKGIALQCRRLLAEINRHISIALYRDVAHELFGILKTPKKRIIAKRQLGILNYLLEHGEQDIDFVYRQIRHTYSLKDPYNAFIRDMVTLRNLKAVSIRKKEGKNSTILVDVRLQWPIEITETQFYTEMQNMPKAKTSVTLFSTSGES